MKYQEYFLLQRKNEVDNNRVKSRNEQKTISSSTPSHEPLTDIEKEINSTLNSFKNEKLKQDNVIYNMKKEVKNLTSMASAACLRSAFGNSGNRVILSEKCNIKVKELEDQLNITKKLLKNKEIELSNANRNIQKLKDEIEILHKQLLINDEQEDIRKNLFNLLEHYNESPTLQSSTAKKLVEEVGKLLKYLMEEKQKIEKKYTRLFELHNMHIEINSKLQKNQSLKDSTNSLAKHICTVRGSKETDNNGLSLSPIKRNTKCVERMFSRAESTKSIKNRIKVLDSNLKVMEQRNNKILCKFDCKE